MHSRGDNSRVGAELGLLLGTLCDEPSSAVRVACVPNGLDYRFLVRVEAPWRIEVYTYLASRTEVRVPPDGGPLNLSREEAVRIIQLIADCGAGDTSAIARVGRRSGQSRRATRHLGRAA